MDTRTISNQLNMKAFTSSELSKKQRLEREPSYVESFMQHRVEKLISIELGDILEKQPPKVQVTFHYSDGNTERSIFGEREAEEIKSKYSMYIKEEVQPEINFDANQANNTEFDLDEKYLVFSSKWQPRK